ncbi:MAG: hypothetical protein JWN73_4864 [Betaproteobacteria bacterium]|nr:hypothetical protein [Betaproteobacteria bacterium]
MSQADKPNRASKNAAGRSKEEQNRISDLERGHARASAGRGDKPRADPANPAEPANPANPANPAEHADKPASSRSSARCSPSVPASLQPPRSDAPAGTPAGSGKRQDNADEGTRSYIQGRPGARADAEPQRKPAKGAARTADKTAADPNALPKPTQPSSKGQNTGMPEARAPDNTTVSDTERGARDTEKRRPGLSFAQGRAALDSSPAERPPAHGEAAGNANLTSHLNDPVMRRTPPGSTAREAEGGSHSGVSPLSRDGVTPAHEKAKLAQDAHDADQRGRLKGLTPREDVQGWHQAEEERQSDLPGRPRKL